MHKIFDLSPNCSAKKRKKRDIKFVIIHYTGMQSEIESLNRLKDKRAKVSCHYLINRKGLVTQLVHENKIAWHAGKSKWKNFDDLNKNSIGIELVNKGHEFGYQNFSSLQINKLINLCKKIKKKYNLKSENFLGHSDISPLRKNDPGEKFPWKKLSKFKIGNWYKERKFKFKNLEEKKIKNLFFKNLKKIGYRYHSVQTKINQKDRLVVKAFQRRYLPNKITGIIDLKTFKISHYLVN